MQQDKPTFNIKRYLSTILRRKYIALSVGLVVVSLFTWSSFFMPKKYKAKTTVSIEKGSVLQPLIQGVGTTEYMEDRLRNLKKEITGRSLKEKVIKKLMLDADIKHTEQYEALIEGMAKNLTVVVSGAPNYFELSYVGDDPKRVTDIVNSIANSYMDEYAYSRKTNLSEAYEFIQNQLLEYKNRLEESDRAIREFRERNPNLIPQSENTLQVKIEGFQTARIEAEIKLKELLSKKDNLRRQLSGEKELTVAFVTREGSPQAKLNFLNNQLMLLMTKYTDNYPEVIRVKSEMEELKKQIARAKDSYSESTGSETSAINPVYQQLKEEFARTEAETESLKARLGELSRQQQEAQSILGRMPKEQEEWTKLQRDRSVYQQIYDQLLHKLENARVSKEIEITEKNETFRVVDPATVPSFPFKPNRIKMILLGIFFGIASGIGMAFGLEYFDQSFKDEDAIEASLKLPVLATIPKIVTEADELSAKRLERKVFTTAGVYLLAIGLVLIEEIIARYVGINIINF